MLVSGGKVLAIDKVKHDNVTLMGDGCFVPLSVVDYIGKTGVETMFTENLKSYYTTAQVDAKFADVDTKFSNIDTKFAELDAKYDPLGAADDVKKWVEETYDTPDTISSTYQSITAAAADRAALEKEIADIYTAGYVNVSGLKDLDVEKQYAIYWKGTDGWEWQEVTGGGGTGGDTVTAENGLTATVRDGKKWIGLSSDYLTFMQHATTAYTAWDTVTGKQDALSNYQLSAISSVSSILSKMEETIPLTGSKYIDVTTNADAVVFSYKGNTVDWIDATATAEATAANTVYMVMTEIG